MTSPAATIGKPRPLPWLRDHAGRGLLLGLAAATAMGVWGLLGRPGDVGAGWLIGVSFWISIAIGAVATMAVHALTGGKWGAALRPALAPAAASLPVFLPLALPVLLGLPAIYPWAADPGVASKPDVARLYLNPTGFVLRTLLGLIGWSLTGLLLVRLREGGARTLAGALGLVFLLGTLTLGSLDWLLSLDPRFRSEAFGVAALIMSMMAGARLGGLAAAGGRRRGEGGAGDLAGLLMTTVLGTLYVGFAQYLVAWYGDLPDKATWFLERLSWGWAALQGFSLLCTAVLPFAALLASQVRRSPAALAWLGPPVLLGVLAHLCWVVGPAFGPMALPAAALGVLAVGGIWLGVAYGPLGTGLAKVSRDAA